MRMNRRQFVEASAAAAVLSAGLPHTVSSAENNLPIVDTHQHLWDLSKFQPPWLKGAPKVITSSHDTGDYRQATKGLNVVKAVYMEIDVAPEQQVEEAKYVIEISASADHPTVAGVISGRPNSEQFASYIQQFKSSPYIKGVRQVLQVDSTPQGFCLQPQFVKSVQLLGELGMSFDLCMRPMELSDGAKLARQCPGTRFIVDHCGNADPKAFMPESARDAEPWHDVTTWKNDMATLAGCDNVVCKISGIVARAPKDWKADQLAPIIDYCLDRFGPNRVMFGSDWPVCKLGASYRDWVDGLKTVIGNRPIADQRKLLHDNAVEFYGLA